MYSSDIFSQTKSDKIKFADDGTIWITGKEPTSLETEIQKDLVNTQMDQEVENKHEYRKN